MFCIKCGSEIPEGGLFCIKCGTKAPTGSEAEQVPLQKVGGVSLQKTVEAPAGPEPSAAPMPETPPMPAPSTAPVPEMPPMSAPPQTEAPWKAIVKNNVPYYETRFAEMRTSGRGRFNWAAFFLSLYHAAYRNMWKVWLQFMWKPIAFLLADGLLCMIALFGHFMLFVPIVLMAFAAEIWMLAASIRYARSFNRLYMQQVEEKVRAQDLTPDPCVGRVFAAIGVMVVIQTIGAILVSAILMSGLYATLNDLEMEAREEDIISMEPMPEQPIPDQQPQQSQQMPEQQPAPEQPPVQASSQLRDYTGSWMVDRYNNFMDGYVGFDLEAREGQLYLTVSAVWKQGDRLTTISDVQLELNAEGTSGGAPYQDDRGNIGDVMLFIENGTPYLTVTVRGDHQYGIEMEYERCSRREEQQDAPMETAGISEGEGELQYWFYWFDAMQTFSNEIYTMEDLAERTLGSKYLWPSDFMEISEGYLNEVTQVEVAMIRNEIFARHGYIFSSPAWDRFFRTASWYVPNPNYSEDMLSVLEKENLKIITEYEKAHGWK